MDSARHFRKVLGRYPTGVCVVTSCAESGERWGLTVGSFTSISLDPPLVGFFSTRESRTWDRIERTGQFCINVLSSDQLDHCKRFASREEDKFCGVLHGSSPAGMPVLDGTLAWVECNLERTLDLGDHLLVVGAVRSMERCNEGSPLVFCNGGYHTLTPVGPEPACASYFWVDAWNEPF